MRQETHITYLGECKDNKSSTELQNPVSVTGLKQVTKSSQAGFNEVSSHQRPEPAIATIWASWLVGSKAAATLIGTGEYNTDTVKIPNIFSTMNNTVQLIIIKDI